MRTKHMGMGTMRDDQCPASSCPPVSNLSHMLWDSGHQRQTVFSANLLGLFFTCKLLITKAITISDFSTGDASTPLFRPEFLTSWEHLAPCNNVRMLCYCTKMMVCWRGENWPSFLSRAAKNFSCSVKNYDLLIAAAATKVASTIPNSSGVIFLDMLFLLSYFWWGLFNKNQ